jgi:antitoxin component of RelBE/YafQ-DinJ toxin-antitoxin module
MAYDISFDDLIPSNQKTKDVSFDDLIPKKSTSLVTRPDQQAKDKEALSILQREKEKASVALAEAQRLKDKAREDRAAADVQSLDREITATSKRAGVATAEPVTVEPTLPPRDKQVRTPSLYDIKAAPVETKAAEVTPAAPAPTPTTDESKVSAAFSYKSKLAEGFKPRAEAMKEKVEQTRLAEENKIPFDALTQSPALKKTIDEYVLARFGKSELQKPNESVEDYVNRFAQQMRFLKTGNTYSLGSEIQFLNSAKQEDKLKMDAAYTLWDNIADPSMMTAGGKGQKGIRPITDSLLSMFSDPLTFVSLGAGKMLATPIQKAVAEQGLKVSNIGKVAAIPAIETAQGVASDTGQQKIELTIAAAQLKNAEDRFPSLSPEEQDKLKPTLDLLRKKVEEGINIKQAIISGAVSGVMGSVEAAGVLKAGKKLGGGQSSLDEILARKKSELPEAPAPKLEIKPSTGTQKQLEDDYDIFEGRNLLDKQLINLDGLSGMEYEKAFAKNESAVAQMQVRKEINRKATQLAQEVWTSLPEFAPKQGEKVSDAVKNVFLNIDSVDDVALKDAFAKANITPEEFARMNRTTVSDAASTMQSYSVLARIQNKLKSIDPAAAKEVDLMYGNRNAITDSFGFIKDIGMRMDKELKALMVSQIATTVRNAYSGLTVVTFGAASEAVESALYRVGKTSAEIYTGKPVTGSFTNGIKGVWNDAFRTASYLSDAGLSADVAERLLAGSPTLSSLILKTAGEAGDQGLSRVGQIANTFNVAQDAFFRRAIFAANVEKQLSRVGIDMFDVLAQNKNIPLDVLKNATNEALLATFSKMPTKGPVYHAVKFIEELGPVGSTLIPFPRFMANAMEWTATHSPIGLVSGAVDVASTDLNKRIAGLEKLSKGIVGTGAIYAAYKYRKDNQDTEWYDAKNTDGSLVDTRAFFPFAPFLALGDYLVKLENGTTSEFKAKELFEAVTGFKMPAGTNSWLGDQFATAASNWQASATGEDVAQKKVSTFFGEWAGQYFGRALIPLQQLSDIIGAVDRNETLPRSVYEIKQGEEGFVASAKNVLMSKVPVLKQELPVSQPVTKTEASFNDAGLLKMFAGITIKVNPTDFEKEITRLNVPYNKLFTTTGDKVVDRQAKEILAPQLVASYEALTSTDFYKNTNKDLQKISLENTLAGVQKEAKAVAVDMARAKAIEGGLGAARVVENRYAAKPAEVKRQAAALYKQNTGKDLTETGDYEAGLAYATAVQNILKPSTNKAAGGVVGYAGGGVVAVAKKLAGETVERGITKIGGDLLQQMDAMLGKKVGTEIEETAAALKATKETALGKSMVEPIESITSTKRPVFRPTSTSKVVKDEGPYLGDMEREGRFVDAPEPILPKAEAPAVKLPEEEVPVWKKQYDLYKKYEAQGEDVGDFDPDTPFSWNNPEKAKPVVKQERETIPTLPESKVAQGDLDATSFARQGPSVRKQVLATIRQARTDSFDALTNLPKVKELPDAEDIIAVVQGDFRIKEGREINPSKAADIGIVQDMATKAQKKLDALREEYKDTPPVKLYHGKAAYAAEPTTRYKTGFLDPQQIDKYHSEMEVGGTSFTRDLNLNFESPVFGGPNADKIVYTEMPYADYMFKRINMAPTAYDNKNLNVIAQSINGSDRVVRPVSLPRSSNFKETEDMITETDKLRPEGKGTGNQLEVRSAANDVTLAAANPEKVSLLGKGGDKKGFINRVREETNIKDRIINLSSDLHTEKGGVAANKIYKEIRNLFNNYMEKADITSTKAGMGQRYHSELSNNLNILKGTDSSILTKNLLSTTSDILEKQGSKEKAMLLRSLSKELKVLGENWASDAAGQVKNVNNIRELTQKLAKGGLVERR